MKKLFVLIISIAIISCIIVIVSLFANRNNPVYSVKQIQKCILHHDWSNFQKWVDVDAFISSLTENFKSISSDANNDFAEGLSNILNTTIITSAKEELRKYIENPSSISENQLFNDIFILDISKTLRITKEGKLATINISQKAVNNTDSANDLIIFRKESGRYRLIGVKILIPKPLNELEAKIIADSLANIAGETPLLANELPIEVIVNIAGTDGERFLKVALILEYDNSGAKIDGNERKEAVKKKATIKDALSLRMPNYKSFLIDKISTMSLNDITAPDAKEKIRKDFLQMVNPTLPPNIGKVRDVYFTQFIIQ